MLLIHLIHILNALYTENFETASLYIYIRMSEYGITFTISMTLLLLLNKWGTNA